MPQHQWHVRLGATREVGVSGIRPNPETWGLFRVGARPWGSLRQRYHDARDGRLETFECLVLGNHGRCRGSLRLALLFGHYLEQLSVLKPLVLDYRPDFFHFS